MSSKFKLVAKVKYCLESQSEKRLTARQIAEWIFNKYPKDCEEKRQESNQLVLKHSDSALIAQISAEITSADSSGRFSAITQIKTTGSKPRQFYWTEKSDAQEIAEAEQISAVPTETAAAASTETAALPKPTEYDLYPLLAEFLQTEMQIYSKRIDEKTSSNSRGENGNKWLHPDIVGLEYLGQNWGEEIKNCAGAFFSPAVRLSAYEVKLKLNSANVREAFFQAVSNASWANSGYLVAAEIDRKIEDELRLLANLHGIGIILLNAENPAESQIMMASAERIIDWGTVNRIASENKDFLEYIRCVRETITIGRIKAGDWYKIPKAQD